MNTNQPNQPKTPTTPNPETINTSSFTQTPVQSEAPKKKRPWLVISIIVLLLSTSGVLGYKYYELQQKVNDLQQPTPQPSSQLVAISPSPVVSPAAEINPTVNWKTYTNNEYGFTMKVPPEFDISISTDKLNKGSISVNNYFKLYFGQRRKQELEYISSESENLITIEPEELPSINLDNKKYPVKKKVFGSGNPVDDNCFNTSASSTYYIDIIDQSMIIAIYTQSGSTECNGKIISQQNNFDEKIKMTKQILSTFEFID